MRERPRNVSPGRTGAVQRSSSIPGEPSDAASRPVIEGALEVGVTFFDTADIYGQAGGSETVIGRVLDGRRDQVVLATKFGKEMGDGATRRGSRDYILRALDASLERLQT